LKIESASAGHTIALITVVIWGVTFVSTKMLLEDFTPLEILVFRFGIGFTALSLLYPHFSKNRNKQLELMFAGAGLCGVTLYFLFENIALTYTLITNVAIIVSLAPFFTAMLSRIFLKEKLNKMFFVGFAVAMIGVVLISFNGNVEFEMNLTGDLLSVFAALAWAFYMVFMRKIGETEKNTIQNTRRAFFYGLLFMIPAMLFLPFELDLGRFVDSENVFNILFLGLGASAMCFVSWNTALKVLGAAKTSVYIYLIPAVAIVFAALVLDETITIMAVCGAILTIAGLVISEKKVEKTPHTEC
jgi:Permeases of the drug/metabolite transporter (DMT) superfamily